MKNSLIRGAALSAALSVGTWLTPAHAAARGVRPARWVVDVLAGRYGMVVACAAFDYRGNDPHVYKFVRAQASYVLDLGRRATPPSFMCTNGLYEPFTVMVLKNGRNYKVVRSDLGRVWVTVGVVRLGHEM